MHITRFISGICFGRFQNKGLKNGQTLVDTSTSSFFHQWLICTFSGWICACFYGWWCGRRWWWWRCHWFCRACSIVCWWIWILIFSSVVVVFCKQNFPLGRKKYDEKRKIVGMNWAWNQHFEWNKSVHSWKSNEQNHWKRGLQITCCRRFVLSRFSIFFCCHFSFLKRKLNKIWKHTVQMFTITISTNSHYT